MPDLPSPISGLPFLFVEGFGPSSPVVSSGPRGIQFIYDPALGLHIHRFASRAEFDTEAREIINHESMWKIFPGLDPEVAGLVSIDAAELECLRQKSAALDDPAVTLIEINALDSLRADNAKLERATGELAAELQKLQAENAAKPTPKKPVK